MQCPECAVATADAWAPLVAYEHDEDAPFPLNRGAQQTEVLKMKRPSGVETLYSFDWMRCANPDCAELVVRIRREIRYLNAASGTGRGREDSWIAIPRDGNAPTINRAVPGELAQDVREAYAIMGTSPRMAAVLTRSVLEELLRDYAGCKGKLTDQIGTFLRSPDQPASVKDLVDPLRALGDWGAHPFRDSDGNRIEVQPELVEWALKCINRLFDHFIVTPARDAEAIQGIKDVVQKAGRTELRGPTP